jgi:hypothetical protein
MVNQWRVRLIFIHCQPLYQEFILPISASIDNVIKLCYEYVNYLGIGVDYQKNFNINHPLYIRPLTTDNIITLMEDGIILNDNKFGERFINDVGRFTPLAAIYIPTDNSIWKTRGDEREILIGCTMDNLSVLLDCPGSVGTLFQNINIPPISINNVLIDESVQYMMAGKLELYNINNIYTNDNILLHIPYINITTCWVVPRSMNIEKFMNALRINESLLPRVIFTGFNAMIKVYKILLDARAICGGHDFIIIFATDGYIDHTVDNSMYAMRKEYPEVVDYGNHQHANNEQLEGTVFI